MATQQRTDGTFSFYGGMDLSRVSYEIDPRQFANGVNLAITTVGDNLQPRPGWHCQTVKFNSPKERDYFETGHVQGGGWYFDGKHDCLVLSVSGRLFYFKPISQGNWTCRCLNLGNPNNPTRTKVWTCRIPGNRIVVSDGQVLPYVLGLDGAIFRPSPSKGEMGVCRAMAYVQQRLWWVNNTGNLLYGSDINNPLSIQEAIDTNVFGFVPGDNRETITAVGQQRYINRDLNGGELVFSTENNVYAVNVQANVPREEWGYESGAGTVRLVIPDSGAVSPFSFTSFNTNLFYRTRNLGVANYRQIQAQWANNDELISNSIEVDYYYSADTEWMLDQCWTVAYKGRLLTTVSPRLVDGYTCWGGIISMSPAPYYGGQQRLPRRFEGLWTGVRPWCLLHQQGLTERLYTISHDGDGKNRLYMLADKDRFDIDPKGKRRPIRCIIETRSYTFETMYNLKTMISRFYTLDQIRSNVKVKGYSRTTLSGPWGPFFDVEHKLPECCPACLPYNPVAPEPRKEWYLPGEAEDCGNRFTYRQYRFEYEGDFELSGMGFLANVEPDSTHPICEEPDQRSTQEPTCGLKLFDYLIVPEPILTTSPSARVSNTTSNTGSNTCGCKSV